MARNIVILSDGTGQRGGLQFDERRSNIYKLYRATRCGPDSSVDPTRQVALYDPGLGTLPGGIDSPAALLRSFYNLASQGTGLGITRNIVDCYADIIGEWREGDRIFLFGFSRGAYTVRCLAGVLRLCGVPTRMPDGSPIRRDPASIRALAAEGVRIYNYTNSRPKADRTPRQEELLNQRRLLANRFREQHRSGDKGGNARPYFIGVFDTVASLANPLAIIGLAAVVLAVIALVSLASLWLPGSYLEWFLALGGAVALAGISWNLISRIKFAFGLPGIPWWRTIHLATARMKMYDTELDPEVSHARHALAIDEHRASFQRVAWTPPEDCTGKDPQWFEQVWFAGNHSDVGGSYSENESRLSDIALQWMVDAAAGAGLLHDHTVLRAFADPTGMQHDESKSSVFRFARKIDRRIPANAPLHPSVLDRFSAKEVLHYDENRAYRPEALRKHGKVAHFYPPNG
ncbi:MAG TPA: DUF2235 domain-containing protein [Allosphingosinicella sp.]|jgi:uncharacterized protein (DUF2235 family)